MLVLQHGLAKTFIGIRQKLHILTVDTRIKLNVRKNSFLTVSTLAENKSGNEYKKLQF